MAIIPSTQVELVPEVGNVLNAAGGSINVNKALEYFTTAAKINKWSKEKPMSYSKNEPLTYNEKMSTNFGLTNIPVFSRIGSMFNFMNGSTNSSDAPSCGFQSEYFKHQLPTGTSSSPYRLADFRGYDTTAIPPVGSIGQTNFGYSPTDKKVSIVFASTVSPTSVSVAEMVGGTKFPNDGLTSDKLYLGCALVNNSQTYIVTQSQPLSSGMSQSLTFEFTNFSVAGTYTCFIFASNVPYSTQSNIAASTSGTFIPFVFTKTTVTVNANIPAISLWLNAYKSSSSNIYVYYDLHITNSGNETYNQYSVSASVYNSSGVLLKNDSYTTNGTIGANSTLKLTGKTVNVGSNNINAASSIEIKVTVGGVTFTSPRQAISGQGGSGEPV